MKMKTEERSRHTVWMEDAVWKKVPEQYKQDRCSTQNEFIAKAILFYCGYLQSEYAGDFPPKVLGETLEAILGMFGDHIGKLLSKKSRQGDKNILSMALHSVWHPSEWRMLCRPATRYSFPSTPNTEKRIQGN